MDWIVPAILIVMLIGLFVMNSVRRKKYNEQVENMQTGLKKGDEVITYTGIIGNIESIEETDSGKTLILKTGDKANYGYIRVDSKAIYGVTGDNKVTSLLKEEAKKAKTELSDIDKTK